MSSKINKLREIHGIPSDGAQKKVLNQMSMQVQQFIEKAPFAILATSNARGDCDASPRGGLPGFIKVLDEKTLLIPDIKGNRLFQSYQNIDTNGKLGIIFLIPGNNNTVRVNGRAKILGKKEVDDLIGTLEVNAPDMNSILIQGLMVSVDEAYTHCPRALQFSDLWNTEKIDQNKKVKLK